MDILNWILKSKEIQLKLWVDKNWSRDYAVILTDNEIQITTRKLSGEGKSFILIGWDNLMTLDYKEVKCYMYIYIDNNSRSATFILKSVWD